MALISATSLSAILSSQAKNDLVLSLTIEGIPIIFTERALPSANKTDILSGPTTPAELVVLSRVQEGESRIDLIERKEEAATLDIEMIDDASNSLRTLFAANTRPKTFWTADYSESATGNLNCYNTTPLASSGFVYAGRETIWYTSKSPGYITVNGRGVWGSKADNINGDATAGDYIYSVPPFWTGRRAYLYGTILNHNGTGSTCRLGTFIVDVAPSNSGNNKWQIRCAGVAQEYHECLIGVGIQASNIDIDSASVSTTGSEPVTSVEVSNDKVFKLANSIFPNYVVIKREKDVNSVHEMTGFSAGVLSYVTFPDFRRPILINDSLEGLISAKQFSMIGGNFGGPIARILRSYTGDGALAYDILPGKRPSYVGDTGWRTGANLDDTEIDFDSFIAINTALAFTCIIDKEQKLADLLREFCWLGNCFTTASRDGLLKAVSLNAPFSASKSIAPSDVIADQDLSIIADEENVYPVVKIKCNYSPLTEEFNTEINLIDEQLFKRMQRAPRTLELEFKSIGCIEGIYRQSGFANPSRYSVAELAPIVSSIVKGDGNLCNRLLQLKLSINRIDVEIGDVFTFSGTFPDSYEQIPDLAGGVLTNNMLRLIAKRVNYDTAIIECTFQILEVPLVVCPAAPIVFNSGAGTVLQLGQVDRYVHADACDNYWVGASVRIYDRSARTYSTHTITNINPGTFSITVSPAVAFAIQNNVDYVCLDPATSSNGTSVHGYSLTNMAIVADLTGTVGSRSPRWG